MKRKSFKFITVTLLLIALLVSCKEKVSVTDITLDNTKLLLPIGGTATLTATVLPYDATNRSVSWTSDNHSVATVSSSTETKGLVSAKDEGTATITATTKDGKQIAKCTVTVVNPEPELIPVEGDTFTMGCMDGECNDDGREEPAHKVTLSSFKIAKYTVTQEQWEAVMGSNPSWVKGKDLPVETVNWNNIQEFIQKLNTLTGKNYRLPTEAEWEYAARGGNKSKKYKYSGSNDINAVAWYDKNSGRVLHPIGKKLPNELGIYDMSGNVLEWCSDFYGAYSDISQTNPTGAATGNSRVIRGGSYFNIAQECRVAYRSMISPSDTYSNLGFRLVLPF